MKKYSQLFWQLVLLNVAAMPSLAQGRDRCTYYDNQSPSSRVYYDQRYRDRSFWNKHRDKLMVGAGTVGGAIIGGLIGGKKGAVIGAQAGAGGSKLYTYKIRNRQRLFWR